MFFEDGREREIQTETNKKEGSTAEFVLASSAAPTMMTFVSRKARACVLTHLRHSPCHLVISFSDSRAHSLHTINHNHRKRLPLQRQHSSVTVHRTHQLNVHCAAFGHPIVGDTTYGLNGDAAPNGGLSDAELESLAANPNRASAEVQEQIAAATSDKGMCVHAKSISFRHPCIKHENIDLSADAAF